MALTLAQIRAHIYEFFELDVDDVPQSLVDRWAAEGYTRLSRLRENLPFYQQTIPFTLTSGTYIYTEAPGTTGNLRSVEAVLGPDGPLKYMHLRDAIEYWQNTDYTVSSGRPRAYSRDRNNFYVWPTPDAAHVLNIIGYREPAAAPSVASEEPDLPDELHEALLLWVKYRVYLHQDDTELAEIEKFNFDETTGLYLADLTRTEADIPVIVGGGVKPHDRRFQPPRADSDWD